MLIIDYKKQHHKKIIHSCVLALKSGKVVAYPTDTSYGLAVDASNIKAIKNLYKIKGRNFNKASSVVVPSVAYAKKIVKFEIVSSRLVKKFWPGAVTLVLELKVESEKLKVLSSKSGWIGLRMPKNNIALDLAKYLGRPITATSANVSGQKDCYSSADVISQFSARGGSASGGKNTSFKPDIIIDAGKLPKRKPSTIVKVENNQIVILRQGPVNSKEINKVLVLTPRT